MNNKLTTSLLLYISTPSPFSNSYSSPTLFQFLPQIPGFAPSMAAPTVPSKTRSEQNFVPKLPHTGPNLELLDYYQLFLGTKEDDGEIGVFQAEKYFNGVMDRRESPTVGVVPEDNLHHKKEQEQDQEQDIVMELKRFPKVVPCTPSIVSESSANSQSALLRKNPVQRKPDRAHGGCRGFLSAAICCKCSVGVHRKVGGGVAPARARLEQRSELVRVQAPVLEELAKNKSNNSLRLGNRVAILNSEFTRKEEFETESNASSDLFEIESVTGKVRRQTASDFRPAVSGAGGGYAPSEVSIQWSVVTASVADFSVVSDFDDGGGRRRGGCAAAVKGDGDGGRRRVGGGALMGCKSQKAVRVAGDALRSVSWKNGQVAEERRRGAAALGVRNPVARFQAETRLAGFDVKYGKRGSQLLYVGS